MRLRTGGLCDARNAECENVYVAELSSPSSSVKGEATVSFKLAGIEAPKLLDGVLVLLRTSIVLSLRLFGRVPSQPTRANPQGRKGSRVMERCASTYASTHACQSLSVPLAVLECGCGEVLTAETDLDPTRRLIVHVCRPSHRVKPERSPATTALKNPTLPRNTGSRASQTDGRGRSLRRHCDLATLRRRFCASKRHTLIISVKSCCT